MSVKDNLIFLKDRRKKVEGVDKAKSHNETNASIQDISDLRQLQIQAERRKVKRTILQEFIGAFVVLPGVGLVKIALHDVSESGIGFDLDKKLGKFPLGEEIAMRVYLNNETYFPFFLNVRNVRFINEEKVFRHGGDFIKDSINDEALYHFIKFIEMVSTSLKADKGDLLLSNL